MKDVTHIDTPSHSVLITDNAVATVPKYSGPTPVQENMPYGSTVAWWGPSNLWPQDVIKDIETYALMGNVIDRKSELLVGGGMQYGVYRTDPATGVRLMEPMILPEIEDFKEAMQWDLYESEASEEWYTYHNLMVELRMNRAFDRITGFSAHDASHMRLGQMNNKAEITEAYLADWGGGVTEGSATKFRALDPYRNMAEQIAARRESKWILPVRYLTRGQFYYGKPTWDALRYKWIPIAKRVPELKELLLKNLMHLPYHLEFDERFFQHKYKGWVEKSEDERIGIMRQETNDLSRWLKGDGQGGAIGSIMKSAPEGAQQTSLLRINQMKINMAEGAYIEDSQEADFVCARDMGLKPSLIGISPSKSGSSPGSGSEDRMSRSAHILAQTKAQNAILKPMYLAKKVNKWPANIDFTFANYYVSTLDRTNEVSGENPDTPGK